MRRKLWSFAVCFALGVLLWPSAGFATSIDLTGATLIGNIGTAFFQRTDDQSTGTGLIDPFLSIKANGSESGFNTDYTPLPLNAFKAGNPGQTDGYTRALLLTEVSAFDRDFGAGMMSYRLFLLDVNESDNDVDKYISLNDLQIYLGTINNPSTLSYIQNAANTTLVYKFSSGDEVLLDAKLNHGSGSGDMFLWVPDSLFTGTNPYVYLYSQFGTTPPVEVPKEHGQGTVMVRDYGTSDGFEEWAVLKGGTPTVVPEPATVILIGTGLIGIGFLARRRKSSR